MVPPPGPQYIRALDNCIRALKNGGVWQRLNGIGGAAPAAQNFALNWIAPGTNSLVLHGTPTYSANQGYLVLNGVDQYLDSQFVPITASAPWNISSAHFGLWTPKNLQSGNQIDIGVVSTGFLELVTRFGAATTLDIFNSSSGAGQTGGAITDGSGHTVWSKSGSTVTVYKGGISDHTTASTGSFNPTRSVYLGARNNNGTADDFSTRGIKIWHYGGALTAQQAAALYNALNIFLAAILPINIYVSSVNYGGIPIGNDSTGDGSIGAPYLTLDHALSAVSSGQHILCNGNPAAPTTYQAATHYVVSVGCTIDSVVAGGAILTAQALETQVIHVAPPNSSIVRFGNIKIDAANSNTYAVSVATNTNSALWTLGFTGTTIANAVQYGVRAVNNNSSYVLITTNGLTFTGSTTHCCFLLSAIAAGGATLSGDTYTISAAGNDLYTGIGGFVANASGAQFSATNITANITTDSAQSSIRSALTISNIKGWSVTNSTIVMDTTATANGAAAQGILAEPVNTLGLALDTGNGVVSGCTVTCNSSGTSGGKGIALGYDGTLDNDPANGLINGCVISGNTVNCNAAAAAAGLHALFAASHADAQIIGNYVVTAGIGIVMKEVRASANQVPRAANNVVVACSSSYILCKGAQDVVIESNTVEQTSAFAGQCVYNEQNPTTGNFSLRTIIQGNIFYNSATAVGVLVSNDASNTVASITNNDYYAPNGFSTAPWRWSGTNYGSFAAWVAAAIETSPYNINPQFVGGGGATGYELAGSNVSGKIARDSSVLTDYLGRSRTNPTALGAFEYVP